MRTILVDAVHTFIIKGMWVDQQMYKLLEWYENKKIILTNANDEQIKKYKIDTQPYEFFSMKHQPDKPNPLFYTTFLNQYWLKADEVIYFEHDESAVVSAQSIWITTFHFDKKERDLISLKAFLDKHL